MSRLQASREKFLSFYNDIDLELKTRGKLEVLLDLELLQQRNMDLSNELNKSRLENATCNTALRGVNRQLSSFEKKINTLQEQIEHGKAENALLEDRLEMLKNSSKAQILELSLQAEEKDKNLLVLQKSRDESEFSRQAIEKELIRLKEMHTLADKKVYNLVADLNGKNEEIQRLKASQSAGETRTNELIEKNQSLTSEVARLQSDLNGKAKEAERKDQIIAERIKEFGALQHFNGQLEEDLKELRARSTSCSLSQEKTITDLTSEKTRLQKDLDRLSAAKEEIERMANRLEEENKTAQAIARQREEEVKVANGMAEQTKEEVKKLKSELRAARESESNCKNEKAAIEKGIQGLLEVRGELSNPAEMIGQLKDKIERISDEAGQLKISQNRLISDHQSVLTNAEKLWQTKISEKDQIILSKDQIIRDLRIKTEAAQNTSEEHDGKLRKCQEEIEELQTACKNAKDEISASFERTISILQVGNTDLTQKNDLLRSIKSQLEKKLQILDEDHHKLREETEKGQVLLQDSIKERSRLVMELETAKTNEEKCRTEMQQTLVRMKEYELQANSSAVQLSELQKSLTDKELSFARQGKELDQCKLEKEEINKTLKSEVFLLKSQFEKVQTERDVLSTQLQEKTVLLKSETSCKAESLVQITRLEGENKNLRAENTELKTLRHSSAEELRSSLAKMGDELGRARQAWQDEKSRLEREGRDLVGKIDNYKAGNADFSSKLAFCNAELDKLKLKLESGLNDYGKLQLESEEKQAEFLSETRRLQNELLTIKNKVTTAEQSLSIAHHEGQQAKRTISEHRETIKRLEGQTTEQRILIDELRQKGEGLEKEHEAAKTQIQELSQSLAEIRDENLKCFETVVGYGQSFEALNQSKSEAIENLSAGLSEKSLALVNLEKTVKVSTEKVADLELRLSNNLRDHNQMINNHQSVKAELASKIAIIEKLEAELRSQEDNLTTTNNCSKEQALKIADLTFNLSNLKTQNGDLNLQLNDIEAKLNKLEQEKLESLDSIRSLEQLNAKFKLDIIKLEQQNKRSILNFEVAGKVLEQTQKKLEHQKHECNEKINEHLGTINKIQNDLQMAREKINADLQDKQRTTEEIDKLNQAINSAKTEQQAAQSGLSEAKAELEDCLIRAEAAQAKFEQSQGSLEECRVETNGIRAELQQSQESLKKYLEESEAFQTKLQQSQESLTKCLKESSAFQVELQQNQESLKGCRVETDDIRVELQQSKESLKKYLEESEALQAKLQQSQESLKGYQLATNDFGAELQQSQESLKKCLKESSALQVELQQSQESLKGCRVETDDIRAELQRSQKSLEGCRVETNGIRAELQQSKESLKKYLEESKAFQAELQQSQESLKGCRVDTDGIRAELQKSQEFLTECLSLRANQQKELEEKNFTNEVCDSNNLSRIEDLTAMARDLETKLIAEQEQHGHLGKDLANLRSLLRFRFRQVQKMRHSAGLFARYLEEIAKILDLDSSSTKLQKAIKERILHLIKAEKEAENTIEKIATLINVPRGHISQNAVAQHQINYSADQVLSSIEELLNERYHHAKTIERLEVLVKSKTTKRNEKRVIGPKLRKVQSKHP